MTRQVQLRELLIGIEGLALHRRLYDGTDAEAQQRLTEIGHLLSDSAYASSEPVHEASPPSGYRSWSASYDDPGNPIVELEEPAVWSLLERLEPGSALDAACGTGRHARHLVELGHSTTGIDLTPEMIAKAGDQVAGARFIPGNLLAIPAADEEFELVVCGLALSHVPELDAAVTELARVLCPEGHVVISVVHPFLALLGWHARFTTSDGQRAFVREHPHTLADYFSAFTEAGLRVEQCREPRFTTEHAKAQRRAFRHAPEAVTGAYEGLPAVLVLGAIKL